MFKKILNRDVLLALLVGLVLGHVLSRNVIEPMSKQVSNKDDDKQLFPFNLNPPNLVLMILIALIALLLLPQILGVGILALGTVFTTIITMAPLIIFGAVIYIVIKYLI